MGESRTQKALGRVKWQVAHVEVCPLHSLSPALKRPALLGFAGHHSACQRPSAAYSPGVPTDHQSSLLHVEEPLT